MSLNLLSNRVLRAPFFLSLLTLAVMEATAATPPKALSTCTLHPRFNGLAIETNNINVELYPFRQKCSRSLGSFDPSPNEITMTPALPGIWSWGWGNELIFTPDDFWPADTEFTVNLANMNLPPATDLSSKTQTFRTPPLHTRMSDAQLMSDTAVNGKKVVTMRASFSTRVLDKAAVEKAFQIQSALPADLETGTPQFLWLNRDTEVLVKIPVYRLSKESVLLTALLALPASRNHYDVTDLFPETHFEVRLPAADEVYRIEESKLTAELDKDLRPQQLLTIRTSVATTPAQVADTIRVTVLPEKMNADANSPTDWRTAPVIDEAVLRQGERLKVIPVTDSETAVDSMSFVIEPPTKTKNLKGRYLHVTLPQGFGPDNSLTLKKGWQTVFSAAEPVRTVRFLQPGHMLSLTGSRRLTLHTEGIRKIEWRISRIRDEFLAMQSPVWGSLTAPQAFDSSLEAKSGEMTVPAGTRFATLDLTTMGFTDRPSGVFEIEVRGFIPDKENPNEWHSVAFAQKRLLVTDTALIQKEARDGSRRVFAENMVTGRPAAGLEVSLVAANGLPIETRRTNRDGTVIFRSTDGLEREKAPVAIVSKNTYSNDIAWLAIDDTANLERISAATDGKTLSAEGLTGLLFTERGLYRPGETVHAGLIAARGNLTELPAGMPITLSVTDSSGRNVWQKTVKVTPEGMAEAEMKLSDTAFPGHWVIKMTAGKEVIGETQFLVQDFDAEKLKMKVTLPNETQGWMRPEDLTLKLHLTNHFGTDAKHRRVVVTGSIDGRSTHRFVRYPGWIFADPTGADSTYDTLTKTVLETDEHGEVFLIPEQLKNLSRGGLVSILAEGYEAASGRSATDDRKIVVSPAKTMLGYRLMDSAADLSDLTLGEQTRLSLLAVDPQLNPVPNLTLKVETHRIEYRTALFEDDKGELSYRPEKVGRLIASGSVMTDQNGHAHLTLTDETAKEGDYVVTMRTPEGDVMAEISYCLSDKGLLSLNEGRLADAPMTLSMTSNTVKPGDKARLTLIAPFDGTALLTLESDDVKAYQRVTVSEGRNTVDMEVPETLFGKIQVNAHLLRHAKDRSRLQQGYAFATMGLKIDDPNRTVTPNIEVPAIAESPTGIPVTIKSDKPGRFFVWAVDEGILSLSNYRLPDPKAAILWDRALQVKTYRTLTELMPEDLPLPSPAYSLYGGGESAPEALLNVAANPFRRTAEKATVWWGGLVETGPDPKTLTMTLPDGFNGKVRLMAVGASERRLSDDESVTDLGSREKEVTVREPVVLNAAVPSHVTPGDKFTTAVTVTPKADGSGYLFIKKPELSLMRHFAVKADQDATLLWHLTAPAVPGATDYTFAGLYNRLPLTKTVSTGVRPATLKERFSRWGMMPDSHTFSISELPSMAAHEAYASLTVSNLPIPIARGLFDTFEDIDRSDIDFMLEDAHARLALLEAPLLQRAFGLDEKWREDAEKRLGETLTRLRDSLGHYGIRTPWSGKGDRTTTVRALDLLLSLKRAGRLSDTALLTDTVGAVRRIVSNTRPRDLGEARFDAYSLMLVTLEGTLVPEELETLRTHLDQLNPKWYNDTVALFFARAYRAMRMPDEAAALEGEKLLDTNNWGDWSWFNSLSPIAAESLAGRWGAKTNSQTLIQGLLARSAWGFFALDRAAALGYVASMIDDDRAERSLDSVTIKCAESDHARPQVAYVKSDSAKTLEFPGCRRFDISSTDSLKELYWETTVAGYAARAPETAIRDGLFVEKTVFVNGKPLFDPNDKAKAPKPTVTAGDVVTVEIRLLRDAGDSASPVILTDLMPGGFEPIEDRVQAKNPNVMNAVFEKDRIIWRVIASDDSVTLRFTMRATAPGEFLVPSAEARDTKSPILRGRTKAVNRITVLP